MRNTYSGKMSSIENKKATQEEIIENKGLVTAEETFSAVQTVMTYLNGKETVRKREFGRVRWNQCMTFLKYNMPPAEFKKYCDHINEARRVADDPTHPDYVSPESFGSTVYKNACEEAVDQIYRGNSPEDYATLLALRNMDPNEPVDKKQLTIEKDKILQDEDFKFLTKEENLPHLKAFVINDNGKDYAKHANVLREYNAHAEQRNAEQNPVLQ